MAEAQFVVRLLLALTFLVAAVTKLADRPGTRMAVVGFGLPESVAGPVALLLPLAELAAVALLIPGATAWWGGLLALALLVAFTVGIGVNLARGRTPDCHCFGQIHSEPIGMRTVARNGLLLAMALFVLSRGRANHDSIVFHRLGQITGWQWLGLGAGAALAVLAAVQLWLLLRVLHQNEQLVIRMKMLQADLRDVAAGGVPMAAETEDAEEAGSRQLGLPVGSPAPAVQLPNLAGEMIDLDVDVAVEKALFLLFISPTCSMCDPLMPEVARWQEEYRDHLQVVVLSTGTAEANRKKVSEYAIDLVLLQKDREIEEAYHVRGTPSAVLVHPDGSIASPLAEGADAVRWLLRRFLELLLPDQTPPAIQLASSIRLPGPGNEDYVPKLRIGDPAPEVTLPDLTGRQVSLAEFLGKPTLLLFYGTACSWCRKMLPDLKKWELTPAAETLQLVVVVNGLTDGVQDLGFRSPVLLDPEFKTGPEFDFNGTPMAALLDAEGKLITREGGAEPILELMANPDGKLATAS